ncbi:MAG: hypothetical protein E7490_08345 [Ruminococcaceae bacterium]|nr:hypothetical protein [Oscillospiraceae bacterium]
MKRWHMIISIIIFVLSVIWIVFNIITSIHRQSWIVTTATITFVGLPDGAVIGTYTDINNHTHSDVTLYIDFFHKGYHANVDELIGKEVDIIYNPLTGEVDKNSTASYWFSFLLLLLSSLLMCFCIKSSALKARKIPKE